MLTSAARAQRKRTPPRQVADLGSWVPPSLKPLQQGMLDSALSKCKFLLKGRLLLRLCRVCKAPLFPVLARVDVASMSR